MLVGGLGKVSLQRRALAVEGSCLGVSVRAVD